MGFANDLSGLKSEVEKLNIETKFVILLFDHDRSIAQAQYIKHRSYIEIIYERNECINLLFNAGLVAKTETQAKVEGII